MKLNRILSTVLVIVLLLTGMIATFPMGAAAAEEAAEKPVVSVIEDTKTEEEKLAIITAYQKETLYTSAQEMLKADLDAGYLDSITYKDFAIYVNRYTGVSYYVNGKSGQVLTSNPIDSGIYKDVPKDVLSQITITYSSHAKPTTNIEDYSFRCISQSSFITVTKGEGDTIVVKYFLGESEAVDRVPDAIFASDMEAEILAPMLEKYAALLESHLGAFPENTIKVTGYKNEEGKSYLRSYNPYLTDIEALKYSGGIHGDMIKKAVDAFVSYARTELGSKSAAYKEISTFASNIKIIFTEYQLYNPSILPAETREQTLKLWYETVPNMEAAKDNVFILNNSDQEQLMVSYRLIGKALKANIDFKADRAVELNAKTGYSPLVEDFPHFECSLVYSLAEDGALIVDFPAASFKYQKDSFIVKSVACLPYFGSGDMYKDGYVFFPDGSGTVVEFNDFYSETTAQRIQITGELYGKDYCYATITDKHKEQITMPVYGIVSTVNKGDGSDELIQNGYFAILEDGAALTKLNVNSGGGLHKYAAAYSSFAPYSYDEYKLGDVISVGGNKSYLVVAETGYRGTYRTRYVMLTDPDLAAEKSIDSYYASSYVGMAACYRDYLADKGILEKIADVKDNLPLYIETLGAMNVTQRILTFPVSVSTALTTFEDVKTMYKQLSAEGVNNINFRLTGYSNGGMYFTYPAKVRWERSLGGEKGFESLIAYAKSVNKSSDKNLGIYPDFDFQYINNTAMFDRVSNGKHGSKLVDNRYATKQVYNSVSGLYDTLYSILVSPDTLDGLYDRFIKDYSKYDTKNISVSTLGSDLNSNFDDKNTVSRDAARKHVVSLLNRMHNKNGYSIMTDIGNSYSYEFIDHILNATIDSSHFVNSSYAVPFLGMVLHSYISYAGTPLNYTGSVDYNILHSIENGASLYYILCMQNTNYLKDDETLSKYYGVDYKNWFDDIVESYNTLNTAIGDLQLYEIVDHTALIAERIPNSSEHASDLEDLLEEYVQQVDLALAKQVAAKLEAMRADANMIGKGLEVSIDKAALVADAIDRFSFGAESDEDKLTEADLSEYGFFALLDEVITKYQLKYPAKVGAEVLAFDESDISYKSKFKYTSDSVANADDYVYSDYTSDNGSVIAVTYKDTDKSSATYGKTVLFLINYNNYDVNVRLDSSILTNRSETDPAVTYTVGRLGFVRVDI